MEADNGRTTRISIVPGTEVVAAMTPVSARREYSLGVLIPRTDEMLAVNGLMVNKSIVDAEARSELTDATNEHFLPKAGWEVAKVGLMEAVRSLAARMSTVDAD